MAAAGAAVELPRDLRRKVDSFYTKLMRRQVRTCFDRVARREQRDGM